MNETIDLQQLAVKRAQPGPGSRRPRAWLARYLLPAILVGGLAALLLHASWDLFWPARPVTIVPVLTVRGEVQQEGAPLFQAAGWIEPLPTPFVVSAEAEGIVDTLLVAEGDAVKPGQEVARLITIDADLEVRSAEARVRESKADVTKMEATVRAAEATLREPLPLHAALARVDVQLAQKDTELATLPLEQREVAANNTLLQQQLESGKRAVGALSGLVLLEAQSKHAASQALVQKLQVRQEKLQREREAIVGERAVALRHLELKIDETRQLAEARAGLELAHARLQQTEAELDRARLKRSRMHVRARVGGRVLALLARPGMRVMGLVTSGAYDAGSIVALYDPAMLQVRADVRLEDVPRVQLGQRVKIETPAAATVLDGEVLRITGAADIQKNTLEVKVAILKPPPTVRNGMLVKATFLAPPQPRRDKHETAPLRLLVPRAVVETGEGGNRVWLADLLNGRARLRGVKLGAVSGELVEIVEGLTLADRPIAGGRDGLREGQRIVVTGEEISAGPVPRSGHQQMKRLQ